MDTNDMLTSNTARFISTSTGFWFCFSVAAIAQTAIAQTAIAQTPPSATLSQRTPWTTSRITGSPDPPAPYVTERAFPSLTFDQCLDITCAPGSDRLFVVEQSGRILSFPDRSDVTKADLVVDISQEISGARQVYALTFHPQFQQNRFCYICYIKAAGLDDGTCVSRFTMTDADPPTIDVRSERKLITWLSGGHNGCCLKFGPDGYLYISTGDGVGPNPPDTKRTGQDISDLLSSILRIDVDRSDPGRNYRIPNDNPFVDLAGARGEVWAYGFRNPWRMSFDRKTGDLWVGDVGWELWELLDRVEKGGNYGWSIMEGRQPTNPEWPRGPTPILPPTIDHPHSESSSITDGLTYYGSRLKELHGAHIYGDYDTGKMWAFFFQGGRVVDHREIADTTHRIVGFGEDRHGEFYLLDHTAGTIHRLVPNRSKGAPGAFPRRLSETGLFVSLANPVPAAGVIPYSINAEPWADYATSKRYVAVPGRGAIQAQGTPWTFPQDSVLVKTLSLEMERGNPASRQRLETQILHFDGLEWQPYSYRWNDEQTDAVLLGPDGDETKLDVVDSSAPGGRRRQTWRFSGRAECQRCHNRWSGPPLAFNSPQLDRPYDAAHKMSQLDVFASIGLFSQPLTSESRSPLVNPHDADLTDRARAYLHVNCAHCHRLHAGSAVLSKMQHDLPLDRTDMVGVRPTQGTFGIHAAEVIAAGDPFRSVLLYRMSKLGGGRMPHLGSNEIDLAGATLIREWLQQMPIDTNSRPGRVAAALRAKEAKCVELLETATSHDANELIDRLLSTTTGALMLLYALDNKRIPADTASLVVSKGARHDDVTVRDLYERFLPADQRVKRLGTVVEADQILSLPGDSERGEILFFHTADVQCKNCHRIGEKGQEVGPDLTSIGRKLDRAQLLESILEPSKRIDPQFVTYIVETSDGRILTGLLLKKDGDEVVIKDAQNNKMEIAASQIEQLVPQQSSLMPELLLRDMTAQQVADLLAYLSSLK